MRITLHDKVIDMGKLWYNLAQRIDESRFIAVLEHDGNGLKLRNVRLKNKKVYCGNHPESCDIEGTRKGTWLEGADWVEFNDMVNDVFDELGISANIYTSVCWIRRGKSRRINYTSKYVRSSPFIGDIYDWERTGDVYSDYADYCHREAPNSTYPGGTPGEYHRKEFTVADADS